MSTNPTTNTHQFHECGRKTNPAHHPNRVEKPAVTEVPEKYSQYIPIVKKIVDSVPELSKAYERLEHLCVKFGSRISGSENLERSIDWLTELIKGDGLDSVSTEKVMIPNWVRGKAAGYILSPQLPAPQQSVDSILSHTQCDRAALHQHLHCPAADKLTFEEHKFDFARARPLGIMAIGQSCATPAAGITAEVVEVSGFDEFHKLVAADANAVRGKIVFYNCVFTNYGDTVGHRSRGAKVAAEFGALATLVRSVTPVSLYTPHTGTSQYASIPGFCVPLEDADLLNRLARIGKSCGEPLVVHLFSSAQNNDLKESRNVIAEFRGSTYPHEIVVIGAHIDSWDVGQGAHDDGQGVFVALESIRILKELNLRPKRTIRFVAFTDEENRNSGAFAYARNHVSEVEKTVACIETDVGCFTSIGFGFTGCAEAKRDLEQLASLLIPGINAGIIVDDEDGGVDMRPLIAAGVPALILQLDYNWWEHDYWLFHHTNADCISTIDPKMLIQNVQVFCAMTYLLADSDLKMARSPVEIISAPEQLPPGHQSKSNK